MQQTPNQNQTASAGQNVRSHSSIALESNRSSRAFIVEACNNYESVKSQRDELLAALKAAADDLSEIRRFIDGLEGDQYEIQTCKNVAESRESVLRAVIAKCEGRAE